MFIYICLFIYVYLYIILYVYILYIIGMEYAELSLYNKQGGEEFTKENVIDEKNKDSSLDTNDKQILKKYKKKIIEQRQEIEMLRKRLEKYEKYEK